MRKVRVTVRAPLDEKMETGMKNVVMESQGEKEHPDAWVYVLGKGSDGSLQARRK